MLEEAILKAAHSVFGPTREMEARFNEESGQIDLFQYMTVVDDPSDEKREIALEVRRRMVLKRSLERSWASEYFGIRATQRRPRNKIKISVISSTRSRRARSSVALRHKRQSKYSFSACATENAISSSTSSKTRRARSSKVLFDGSRKATTSSLTLVAPKEFCRFASKRRETYRPGDRIVALLKDIDREARGPQLILSRADGRLLEKLLKRKFPKSTKGS